MIMKTIKLHGLITFSEFNKIHNLEPKYICVYVCTRVCVGVCACVSTDLVQNLIFY